MSKTPGTLMEFFAGRLWSLEPGRVFEFGGGGAEEVPLGEDAILVPAYAGRAQRPHTLAIDVMGVR
jgi:hypothetical protein